jgi:hypothetical protein
MELMNGILMARQAARGGQIGTTTAFHDGRQNRFHKMPVHKRVTYRDNLVVSLGVSRAAGDMGLETGLSSSPGARGRSKRATI